jgi:hypothetical protein
MLSPGNPLASLRKQLRQALQRLEVEVSEPFGRPDFLEKVSADAERVFQGIAKAAPSEARVQQVVRAFLQGRPLDEYERHLLASGLAIRVKELQNRMALGHKDLAPLLAAFQQEAKRGELWRLTWFNLLASYFAFDPTKPSPAELDGFKALQTFLQGTWPQIERQNRGPVVPQWVDVLRREPQLLEINPAKAYAADYLKGNEEPVKRLADELGIPEASWFWHSLVKNCVNHAVGQSDAQFRAVVPRLIGLIRARPAFRDESLAALMERCTKCSDKTPIPSLRDFVINKDVWKNPKLKPLGRAPSWNLVSETAWMMAVGWVNEGLLRDFFQILAGRHGTDEGRLDFWSRYLEQISWTRLCIGSHTRMLANRPEIRALIAREAGAYAEIGKDLDAFVALIGRFIVVEFSTTGNAAYVYDADKAPFDLHAAQYSADSSDLKAGFQGTHVIRQTHTYGWEDALEYQLRSIGIYPDSEGKKAAAPKRSPLMPATSDKPAARAMANDGQPLGAPFTMRELRSLVEGFSRAAFLDERSSDGRGRLKVFNPAGHIALDRQLIAWGFKPSSFPREFYYPVK